MKKKLLITRKNQSIFSTLMDENNRLLDISVEDTRLDHIVDHIYIGKVVNVLPNIHASFVEFKKGRMGFIPDILTPGEKLMVQVVKDSIRGKEPVLSRTPVLTGKYVILTSKHQGLHFSYKFRNPEKKAALLERFEEFHIEECGFIVRTKSLYVDDDVILKELKQLYQQYLDILDASTKKSLYSELYRVLPAHLQYLLNSREDEFLSIITDNEPLYEEVKTYLKTNQEEDLEKLTFYDAKGSRVPISVIYGLKKQLEEVFSEKVYLPSGGHLVIQRTEALNVIDVNSAGDVSKRSSAEEYLKINLEAAAEAARQIRLRNISGIILIDFINMSNITSKQQLLETLKKCLDQDPLGPNVVDMTKLGIVEITRKRMKKPLAEVIHRDFFDS